MGNEGASGGSGAGAAEPLRRGVGTGRDNPTQVAPYEVIAVHVPRRWDPSSETLAVDYDIDNRNRRAISGCILYRVPGEFDPGSGRPAAESVVVHRQRLTLDQVRQGHHELPVGRRWDGRISEGLFDRIGQRVTADLAPIIVVVEIWNHESLRPHRPADQGSGWSDIPGLYLARGRTRAELDVIAEARWDREFVIPYDDPEEPEHGSAKMQIRVRNVAEGTPVRLFIWRIVRPEDPWSDRPYIYTGASPDEQPGLEDATVQGDRVLLGDGSPPEVRFSRYREHWKYPGNNFYCFRVAFGTRGGGVEASERDYVNHERDCLHMRFTVFIHRPAGDLRQYTQYANSLHQFFRSQTRYYRSYLIRGSPGSRQNWWEHFRNRYIVIVLGHAACGCTHPDHPVDGHGEKRDPFHAGFPPDENLCPTALATTPDARRLYAADRRGHAGCGHKSHVFHQSFLGRVQVDGEHQRRNLIVENRPPPASGSPPGPVDNDLTIWPDADGSSYYLALDRVTPHLFFWNGGCRTTLTTNFGERLVDNGTLYYSGWAYSPDCDFGRFVYDVFNRWIKGTQADPAPDEYDVARLLPAYREAATRGRRARYHPRIMDHEHGVLNPAAPPDASGGTMD